MNLMKKNGMLSNKQFQNKKYFANDNSALVPQLWAFESLRILEEQMIMGSLVHRDFSNLLANYGDTVNTRKPAEFTAYRKTDADSVTTQDASSTNVQVVMNQWIHVSFVIKDGERTKAFKDLVSYYLEPAMIANARLLDQSLAGAAVQFLGNMRGGLGQISGSNAADYFIDTDDLLNQNKVYLDNRNLVLSSPSHAAALKTNLFQAVQYSGDGGLALRDSFLGKKFNLNTFMDLNVPRGVAGTKAATTTTTADGKAGDATVAINAAVGKGVYCTIPGDNSPLRSTTNTTTLTPTRKFLGNTTSGAVVTPMATGLVNLPAGYASGYVGLIAVDGTGVPKVGQLVAFNSGDTATGTLRTPEYTIVQVSGSYNILLDRPLETALADEDVVCYGPDGSYNFAFHKNALALVNRPLERPMDGVGAAGFTAVHNNLSMRVVMTYDGAAQGHRVTLDSLFGVKLLDPALGAVLLG